MTRTLKVKGTEQYRSLLALGQLLGSLGLKEAPKFVDKIEDYWKCDFICSRCEHEWIECYCDDDRYRYDDDWRQDEDYFSSRQDEDAKIGDISPDGKSDKK